MTREIRNASSKESVFDERELMAEEAVTMQEGVDALLGSLESPKSSSNAGKFAQAGALSIINSEKCGRRIALSRQIVEHLENPSSVVVGLTDDGIVISQHLPGYFARFVVRPQGAKGIIYAAELVRELVDKYDLDYEERVSKTFYEAQYLIAEHGPVVFVSLID